MHEEREKSSRRHFIRTTIVGTAIGTSGCLRLQSATDEQSSSSAGQSDSGNGGNTRVALSESWTGGVGIDYMWRDDEAIYFNGAAAAAKVRESGEVWANVVEYDGVGGDAFTTDGGYVVFGYIPDDNNKNGAQFHAYNAATGEEEWSFTAPSDGNHDFTLGATHVDGIAAVGIFDYEAAEQEPLVVGIDISTGETLWQTDPSTLPLAPITYLGNYDGEIYVGTNSDGVYILDPDTGTLTNVRESWTVGSARGQSCGAIHGDTLFAHSVDGVHAYAVGDGGLEWTTTNIDRPSTAPVVDNSLMIVGTESGSVYALDRTTGETQWETNVGRTVGSVATSPLRVWVTDTETGLTAYTRENGNLVHRSTKPIDGSEITVIDEVLLFGGNGVRAYSIEPK